MEHSLREEEAILEKYAAREMIGHGVHGRVYLCSWHGRASAIKILVGRTAQHELHNNKCIQDLRKLAPRSVSQFMPEILETGVFGCIGYIIMEVLDELSERSREQLFSPLCKRPRAEQLEALTNPAFVDAIAANLLHSGYTEVVASTTASAAIAALKARRLSDSHDRIIIDRVYDAAARALRSSRSNADLLAAANNAIARISEARSVPCASGAIHLHDAAGKSIRECLEWLASRGLAWRDLHEYNVLSRGGQPVLIDFAEYGPLLVDKPALD